MNTTAQPAASAYFRSWRDLEALIATKGWGVRASPAIGDGADVLYFVPPAGDDATTVQVRHLGKALQASVWALRGSAGSMLSLDPVTAAQVEARPHQWRVEAMVPDHPQFPTRDSFTLVCGDVLVALGFMAPPDPVQDALATALADAPVPPPETAVEALQRRVDRMARLDPAFTVHDAGYSPDDFATTADMVAAADMMDLLDGDGVGEPLGIIFDDGAVLGPDGEYTGAGMAGPLPASRAQFAAALMAAKRKPPAAQRFRNAWAALGLALSVQFGEALAWAHRTLMGRR